MPELPYRNSPPAWENDLEDKLGYERPEWRKRIVALSAFLSNEDKSVMDLGAGHMHLRRLLPDDVLYYPVDYKKNEENTIVCDFNKGEFPEIKVDVICAAGILGYIEDPAWFLRQITNSCKKLLITYKGREKYAYSMLYTQEVIDFLNAEGFAITGKDTSLDEWTLLACFEKITPEKLKGQLACTGCGCCANICPVDAIELKYDDAGYLKPFVKTERCINCGRCVNACPAIHHQINKAAFKKPLCYAAWAKEEIRTKSSSGGFFTVLAEYIINRGGCVFGAIWENGFYCGIHRADSAKDIAPMRYSKYVQSNTHKTYQEVKDLLNEKKPIAYFGCPCQIAGLINYLTASEISDIQMEQLITVDLICFCAPSNQHFRKYLDENYGLDNVKNVNFRDKSSREGWSPVSYKIELKSGDIIYPAISDDRYQMAFHKVLAKNDTCEECEYYRMPRPGDFSTGDFWGIELHDVSWNDRKGTSLILVNDKKAEKIIGEISETFSKIERVPLDYALKKGNRVDDSVRKGHPGRKYFQTMLNSMAFNRAVNDALSNWHDVGLVCLTNLNLGNNLTNYALYQILSDMNLRVLIIGNPVDRTSYSGKDERFTRFLRFPYRDYDIAPICFDTSELYKLNDVCEIFVVGSDQLFREMFVRETNYFTCLDWVRGSRYKISYGTSFGCAKFEGTREVQNKMSYLLKRFQHLSVREENSIALLKNFGCDAECVLDPVFLCNKKHYLDMIGIGKLRTPTERFTGAYFLDITDTKKDILHYTANLLSNGIHQVITDYPERYWNHDINILHESAIEEWLAMIYFCDFFITDSFHGVCFAIIFEKQFCVCFDKHNWRGYTRLQDILNRFGLQDRFIPEFRKDTVYEMFRNPIDYEQINRILNEEKKKSTKWLADALDGRQGFSGIYDTYDIFLDLKQEQKQQELKWNSFIQNDIKGNISKIKSELFILGHNMVPETRNHMHIVGFGAGECFRRNREMITKLCDLKYVCDNSPEKWGQKLGNGIICISPKQLSEMENLLVVIMVDSVKTSFDIAKELQNMGIYNYTHIQNWLSAIEQPER